MMTLGVATLPTVAADNPCQVVNHNDILALLSSGQPESASSGDPLECVGNRIDPPSWMPLAATVGVQCGGMNMRLADYVEGPNFSVWVLVEEADIVDQVMEALIPQERGVIIGWNWQTPLTWDGVTIRYDKIISEGAIIGPHLHSTDNTITTMCGGIQETSCVGGSIDEPRFETYEIMWSFSGAVETIIATEVTASTVEISLGVGGHWRWGSTLSLPPSIGSDRTISFAFGASWSHTVSEELSVSINSYTKSVLGSATVTGGPVVPIIRADGVPLDTIGTTLCATENALDDCIPVDVQ